MTLTESRVVPTTLPPGEAEAVRESDVYSLSAVSDQAYAPPKLDKLRCSYQRHRGRIADWAVLNMPAHETFVCPYGEILHLLAVKPPSRNEVVNDVTGDYYALYKTLRDHPEDFIATLSALEKSPEQIAYQWSHYVRPSDTVRHAAELYTFLESDIQHRLEAVDYATTSGILRDSIANSDVCDPSLIRTLSDRLSEVVLLNDDLDSVTADFADDSDTLVYIDVPDSYPDCTQAPMAGDPEQHWYGWELAFEYAGCRADWMLSTSDVSQSIGPFPVIETDVAHEAAPDATEAECLVVNFSPIERERLVS